MPEKKPNNPFDPWGFLPFSTNTIFPENDSDVEKKIKELKIIESWLNFNLEFTKSVIKTMEIKAHQVRGKSRRISFGGDHDAGPHWSVTDRLLFLQRLSVRCR